MAQKEAIEVLVVDDQPIVRAGVASLLEHAAGIRVSGTVDSGEAAIDWCRNQIPDVVLMDVSMPGMGGLEATRQLIDRFDGISVIALTVHASGPYPAQLLQAGAKGYITKGSEVDEMITAIQTVFLGEPFIAQEVASALAMAAATQDNSPFDSLAARELQVMISLAQGHRVQDIADTLCLSPKTVSTYKYRSFGKLGIDSNAALLRLAMQYKLIDEV